MMLEANEYFSRPSFIERLHAALETGKNQDPWIECLQKLRGKVGNDAVERISTEAIFDALKLFPFQRTPEAGKRAKSIMVSLGWTSVRARHVTSRGWVARVRGYARTSGIFRETRMKHGAPTRQEVRET